MLKVQNQLVDSIPPSQLRMSGIADQFSEKQISEFKEAFSLFDDNKDGTVFMAQIDFVMKALGIHGNEMELRVLGIGFS